MAGRHCPQLSEGSGSPAVVCRPSCSLFGHVVEPTTTRGTRLGDHQQAPFVTQPHHENRHCRSRNRVGRHRDLAGALRAERGVAHSGRVIDSLHLYCKGDKGTVQGVG
uniref:Uncharacterized protein n=1 Tax=Pleurotus ostreatus TaxID=5322 RepID=D2JY83_PLEOS|nr:hypothetical protein [Pleurotus ostreatus]